MQGVDSFIEVLQQYFAGNILLLIAIIAMTYFASKKGWDFRLMLIFTALVGILIFNGFSYKLIQKLGEGDTYYRLLWILPVTMLAAWFFTEIWHSVKKWGKAVLILILVYALGLYNQIPAANWINIPDNIYQLSEEVIEVADIIDDHSEGKRVRMWDEGEIWYSIRQYNANICMPEGNMDGLYYALTSQDTDCTVEQVRKCVAISMADYIVLKKDKLIANSWMQDAGFALIGQTDNYNIYYIKQQELENERTS